jgi:hypothetical protein
MTDPCRCPISNHPARKAYQPNLPPQRSRWIFARDYRRLPKISCSCPQMPVLAFVVHMFSAVDWFPDEGSGPVCRGTFRWVGDTTSQRKPLACRVPSEDHTSRPLSWPWRADQEMVGMQSLLIFGLLARQCEVTVCSVTGTWERLPSRKAQRLTRESLSVA